MAESQLAKSRLANSRLANRQLANSQLAKSRLADSLLPSIFYFNPMIGSVRSVRKFSILGCQCQWRNF